MITSRFLPLTATLALLLAPLAALQAEVLFSEDFESEAYPLDLPIPLDFGVIQHGRWNAAPPTSRPGVVVKEGENQVLTLKAITGFERGSRAIGRFGRTNDAETITDEALRFRFRFKISATLGNSLYLQLGGTDGRSKAMLTMDDSGILQASFAGKREPIGGILEPDHWYTVEVLLPARPISSSIYHVRLYDGENEIGQGKGRMARSVDPDGGNYRYVDLQHNRAGETLFIDDLLVETIPPEEVPPK